MNNTKLNLITHCGGFKVDREQVVAVATPEPTKTWYPLAHNRLITQVEQSLDNCNLEVVQSVHALNHAGAQYFGLFQVAPKPERTITDDNRIIEGDFQIVEKNDQPADYSLILGLRNSHDQTFPAGILAGTQLFVCDNLAFSGEVKISRKHTRFCDQDLPALISRAVSRFSEKRHDDAKRFQAYKDYTLTDKEAHDLIIRSLDNGAICGSQVTKVLKEYRTPRHPEFAQDHNAWRLFNATTEVAKENSIFALPKRTQSLTGLLDGYCGLVLAS